MDIVSLASGSSGNCTLVRTRAGTVLIDAGISCRRITDSLQAHDIQISSLDGILVTHEHWDHISGLKTLLKNNKLPVYTSSATAEQMSIRIGMEVTDLEELIRPVEAGKTFSLGGLEIRPFRTPHDAAGSLGFTFSDGDHRASVVTDLGRVTKEVAETVEGSDFVLLETNYEKDWLLNGPYSYDLKMRILGEKGHLSNADGGEFACRLAETGTKTLLLGHLSIKNNTPQQALAVVKKVLKRDGIRPGEDVQVEVAPRSESSHVYHV